MDTPRRGAITAEHPPRRAFWRGENQVFPWFHSILMSCDPSKSLQAWIVTNNALLPQGKLFLGQWRRCLISPPAQNTDEGSLFPLLLGNGGCCCQGNRNWLTSHTVRTSTVEMVCSSALWSHTHWSIMTKHPTHPPLLLPPRLINSLRAVSHPLMHCCRESLFSSSV